MPDLDFTSDDFHRQRLRAIRAGDIVSDSGWYEESGLEFRIVVRADVRNPDRAAWFGDMIFGSQQSDEEVE